MIIKQLWSKCRLRILFPKRVKIEIKLFIGWKALTLLILTYIIILLLFIPFGVLLGQILRYTNLFQIFKSKILDLKNNTEKI